MQTPQMPAWLLNHLAVSLWRVLLPNPGLWWAVMPTQIIISVYFPSRHPWCQPVLWATLQWILDMSSCQTQVSDWLWCQHKTMYLSPWLPVDWQCLHRYVNGVFLSFAPTDFVFQSLCENYPQAMVDHRTKYQKFKWPKTPNHCSFFIRKET